MKPRVGVGCTEGVDAGPEIPSGITCIPLWSARAVRPARHRCHSADEFRLVAGLVNGSVTAVQFEAHSTVSAATVRRRFGSWSAGPAAAGLDDRTAQRTVSSKMLGRRSFTDTQIIEELQKLSGPGQT